MNQLRPVTGYDGKTFSHPQRLSDIRIVTRAHSTVKVPGLVRPDYLKSGDVIDSLRRLVSRGDLVKLTRLNDNTPCYLIAGQVWDNKHYTLHMPEVSKEAIAEKSGRESI
jgi:hypothetical protein